MKSPVVKIKTRPGIALPERGTAGSCGFDLVADIRNPIVLRAGSDAQLIPTGLFLDMTANPGLGAMIIPRSGMGHKTGLVLGNGVGLIDTDYRGELFVSALNRNQNGVLQGMGVAAGRMVVIEPGMKLAQLVFLNFVAPRLEVVEDFEDETERGEGGFGSTGTK